MLVLARKVGEAILFNDEVVVEVLGIHRGRVRIGIKAPKEVRVLRGELCNSNPQPASSSNPTVCSTDQPEAKKLA